MDLGPGKNLKQVNLVEYLYMLLGTIALATAGAGHAVTPAVVALTSPGAAYTTAPYKLGFSFIAGSVATVTKLGIYDWNADGLEDVANVGL